MKMILNIDGQLLRNASHATGIQGRNALVKLGLETLIYQTAAQRLASMEGGDPKAKAAPRRKSGHFRQ